MFDSREYEWADVTVVMAGRDVTGIRGVSYNADQEKEALYAKGNKPHGIQHGNKSYAGAVRILQSELDALTAAAGGDVLDARFDLVVAYGNPSRGDIVKMDLIRGAEITSVPKGLNQNDKFMEIELPIVALDIVYDYQ